MERILSVDNYVPRDFNDYYDRKEQGIVADYVIVMGYDEHYAGSKEAGSVASIDYVEDGIAQTVKEVPAEKVINAIPFYTRIWETTGDGISSQAVDMVTAEQFISNHGITAEWDETTCQNYGGVYQWRFQISGMAGRCRFHQGQTECYGELWNRRRG